MGNSHIGPFVPLAQLLNNSNNNFDNKRTSTHAAAHMHSHLHAHALVLTHTHARTPPQTSKHDPFDWKSNIQWEIRERDVRERFSPLNKIKIHFNLLFQSDNEFQISNSVFRIFPGVISKTAIYFLFENIIQYNIDDSIWPHYLTAGNINQWHFYIWVKAQAWAQALGLRNMKPSLSPCKAHSMGQALGLSPARHHYKQKRPGEDPGSRDQVRQGTRGKRAKKREERAKVGEKDYTGNKLKAGTNQWQWGQRMCLVQAE